MVKPNWKERRDRFRFTALLGVLLLLIGAILLNHSISAIQDSDQLGVSIERILYYDGSSGWWKNAYVTVFLPLTSVFVALSGFVLVTQPLLSFIHRKKM